MVAQQGGGDNGGGVDEHGLAIGAGKVGQVGVGALTGRWDCQVRTATGSPVLRLVWGSQPGRGAGVESSYVKTAGLLGVERRAASSRRAV